jgi:hypothetical protein
MLGKPDNRLKQLFPFSLTTNVHNKSGNLLVAQEEPESIEYDAKRVMGQMLRFCKQPLRRSKLDSSVRLSHPPISSYCKLLRGILVCAIQIDTKSTHGQIVRS